MLRTLKELFAPLFDPTAAGAPPDGHTLELATAVLLVEVMRADGAVAGVGEAERQAALVALERKFALSIDERDTLLAHAQGAAQDATDLHQFTSVLNARLDDAAKVHMVESMWQVAFADGVLADHERHIIWRVADLLHVRPGDFAAARTRARVAAGLPE
ncbi:MAG: TerB family tellurite resistance protein [Burkholderiales bacterium]|nr:TerB family tellurite resistance protein [Burkholderiales bacterium]